MPIRPVRRILAPAVLLALAALPLAAQQQDPIARGVRLFEQRQYAAARRAIEPYAQSHPQDARAAYYVGRTHLSERSADAAVEWLEKAVELDGSKADHHLHLGNAYGLKAAGSNVIRRAILARKAKAEYDVAVEQAPNSVEARWGLMRFYMVAPGVLGGDMEKAEQQAAEIKRRNPWMGMNAFVTVYRRQENLEGVAREYEAAIRQFPDSVGVYIALGNTYDRLKRHDASLAVWERLVARKPQEMGAYYQIARLSVLTGQRMDRAETLMQRYLRHTPRGNEPPIFAARWRLGTLYERQGQRDRARTEYRASLALNPGFKPAQESLARLGG